MLWSKLCVSGRKKQVTRRFRNLTRGTPHKEFSPLAQKIIETV